MLTIRRSQKTRRAFTTIEMLIVLVTTTLFLSLSIFIFSTLHISDYSLENEFWSNFHSYWEQSIENSKYFKKDTYVYIDDGKVVFSMIGRKMKLSIPKSLMPPSRYMIDITNSGYVAPKSYRWISKSQRLNYIQKIQLGWGIYRIYEQKY